MCVVISAVFFPIPFNVNALVRIYLIYPTLPASAELGSKIEISEDTDSGGIDCIYLSRVKINDGQIND